MDTKGIGKKIGNFVTDVLGTILGIILLCGLFTVPVAVILWSIETIGNFLR